MIINEHTQHLFNNLLDAASVATLVGVLAQILPALASLFTIIWTGIRIYEWWKGRTIKE